MTESEYCLKPRASSDHEMDFDMDTDDDDEDDELYTDEEIGYSSSGNFLINIYFKKYFKNFKQMYQATRWTCWRRTCQITRRVRAPARHPRPRSHRNHRALIN